MISLRLHAVSSVNRLSCAFRGPSSKSCTAPLVVGPGARWMMPHSTHSREATCVAAQRSAAAWSGARNKVAVARLRGYMGAWLHSLALANAAPGATGWESPACSPVIITGDRTMPNALCTTSITAAVWAILSGASTSCSETCRRAGAAVGTGAHARRGRRRLPARSGGPPARAPACSAPPARSWR